MGIIGGNGAGKSTLFRMIMGQEAPDAGKAGTGLNSALVPSPLCLHRVKTRLSWFLSTGSLELGDTVVPMYVDQSRDALDDNQTVSAGWFFDDGLSLHLGGEGGRAFAPLMGSRLTASLQMHRCSRQSRTVPRRSTSTGAQSTHGPTAGAWGSLSQATLAPDALTDALCAC